MNFIKGKHIFLLTFFISGFGHQLLYILFPIIGYIYVSMNDFTIQGNKITSLYLRLFIFTFCLFLLQTFVQMDLRDFSVKGVIRFFSYFCFAIIISQFSFDTIRSTLNNIVKIFLILTPYGVYETISQDRYEFIFGHANNLAYVFVLLIFFLCSSFNKNKWLWVLGLMFNLLLTKSTGGLLTGTIVLFTFLIIDKNNSASKKFFIIGGLLLVIAIFMSVFSERLVEQYNFISKINWDIVIERARKGKFGMFGSGVWRLTYWIAILNEYFSNPWSIILVGEGIDSMTLGNYVYKFTTKDPHNDYVKLIIEMGIIGVLFFAYFIRTIYIITNKSLLFTGLLIIPMMFGNILVNFPFMIIFIAIANYQVKSIENRDEIIQPVYKRKWNFLLGKTT